MDFLFYVINKVIYDLLVLFYCNENVKRQIYNYILLTREVEKTTKLSWIMRDIRI